MRSSETKLTPNRKAGLPTDKNRTTGVKELFRVLFPQKAR